MAVVDGLGSVALAERARRVRRRRPSGLLRRLRDALDEATVNLGVATLLPRVAIVCGPHVVDLSDARRARTSSPAPPRSSTATRGPRWPSSWS